MTDMMEVMARFDGSATLPGSNLTELLMFMENVVESNQYPKRL